MTPICMRPTLGLRACRSRIKSPKMNPNKTKGVSFVDVLPEQPTASRVPNRSAAASEGIPLVLDIPASLEWASAVGGPKRRAEDSFSGILAGSPEYALAPILFDKWIQPRCTIQRVRLAVEKPRTVPSNAPDEVSPDGSSKTCKQKIPKRTSVNEEKDGWTEHPWIVQWHYSPTTPASSADTTGAEEAPSSSSSPEAPYHRVVVGKQTWELDPGRRTKAPGTVRVCCISDTHTHHEKLNPFIPADGSIDMIVHGGDFTDVGSQEDVAGFCEWLQNLKRTHNIPETVVIAGNHDLSLDYEFYEQAYVRFGCQRLAKNRTIDTMRSCCMYLDHQGVVTDSTLKIFGSPYQPEFYDWAFNLRRGAGKGGCREKWSSMPTSTQMDVLVTHGPPLGHGDWVFNMKREKERFGCADLLDFVEAHPPKVHVFGHIHEGHGVTFNGKTLFVNASSMNENYDALNVNLPVIVDIPITK